MRTVPQWISLISLGYTLIILILMMRRRLLDWRYALLGVTAVTANWLFYVYVLLLNSFLAIDSGDFSAWRSTVTAIAAVCYIEAYRRRYRA